MAYRQVRDVLERVRDRHARLRDQLAQDESRSSDERTRHVLAAIRQDEQAMSDALAEYGREGAAASPLATWMQYVPDEDVERTLDEIEFPPGMPADQVVLRKVEFDRALATFYRQLADATSIPRVEELFGSLADQLDQRLAQRAWDVREFQSEDEPPEAGG